MRFQFDESEALRLWNCEVEQVRRRVRVAVEDEDLHCRFVLAVFLRDEGDFSVFPLVLVLEYHVLLEDLDRVVVFIF